MGFNLVIRSRIGEKALHHPFKNSLPPDLNLILGKGLGTYLDGCVPRKGRTKAGPYQNKYLPKQVLPRKGLTKAGTYLTNAGTY